MTLEEIIREIYEKKLNEKCNHYIFSNLNKQEKQMILDCFSSESDVRINPLSSSFESDIVSDRLHNILIDAHEIYPTDLLSYALYQLRIDERIDFHSKMDLLHFRGILRSNKKMIQWIITGCEEYTIEQQKLFNELLWFNTYFWSMNILLESDNLVTYQTMHGSVLDNRENYQKFKISRY